MSTIKFNPTIILEVDTVFKTCQIGKFSNSINFVIGGHSIKYKYKFIESSINILFFLSQLKIVSKMAI